MSIDLSAITNHNDNEEFDAPFQSTSDPRSKYEGDNHNSESEELDEDDEKYKRNLVLKMKKFFQDPQLSKKLQQVEQSDLENLTLDELEDRYHEVKLALSNDNSTGIIGFGYGYGCTLLENLSKTPYSPVSLDGLTSTLMRNDQVLDLLAELNVEYSNFESVTRPEQRLLYITAFTALSVGMTNMNKTAPLENSLKQVQDPSQSPPNHVIIDQTKYNDL